LEYLRRARASLSLPIVALGGMNQGNVALVLDIGVAGVAGISFFQQRPSRFFVPSSLNGIALNDNSHTRQKM